VNKLVILRGPSGSGKTTIANEIFNRAKNPIVLIQQDHYRFIFRPPGAGGKVNSHTICRLIKSSVLIALEDGYDVILEGILSIRRYRALLDDLFTAHSTETYLFHFDVSLDESIRRHSTKSDTHEFGEEDLRQWYPAAQRSNHPLERLIPESYSPSETVAFVIDSSGLELV
jgi:predicted kinase